MFVQNHMTRSPLTVQGEDPVEKAAGLMQERRIHQLPVTDDQGNLAGIVTDRDIRSAVGYDRTAASGLRVNEVMTANPVTIEASATLEEALNLLCSHRFGALPVVRRGRLVGIVTQHDLLQALRDLLGLSWGGTRVEVAIPGGPQDAARALEVLAEEDQVISVVAARLRTDGSEPVLYLRTALSSGWPLERKLRRAGAILLAPQKPVDEV